MFTPKTASVTVNRDNVVVVANNKFYIDDAIAEKIYNLCVENGIDAGSFNPSATPKASTGRRSYGRKQFRQSKDILVIFDVDVEGKRKKTYAVRVNAAASVDACKKGTTYLRKDVLRVISKACKESGGIYNKESRENVFGTLKSFEKFMELLNIKIDADHETYFANIKADTINAIWDNKDWSDEA